MFLLDYFRCFYLLELFVFVCLLILSGLKVNMLKIILYTLTSIDNYKNKKSIYKMNDNNTAKPSSSERITELKIDSTLWATPAKIINLLDFDPKKLSIDKALNSIHSTPDASSKDLIDIHQVRYENGGFYLTIGNTKGYFNLDDNVGGISNMILNDDQKNKHCKVWKEVFKIVDSKNGELRLHKKIRLCDSNLPIEEIFKILSITIVIKSLIEKNNKFYLELSLNHCLYEDV